MCPAVPMTMDRMESALPFRGSLSSTGPLRPTPLRFRALPACRAAAALYCIAASGPNVYRARDARPAIAFRFTDPIEDLGQAKIDLPPLHVDLDDLDRHFVAEPEYASGVLTAEDVCTVL